MIEFSYARAEDALGAIGLSSHAARPKYLGGGTNLVDLMRETVEQPDALIDVTGLSSGIEERDDGSMLIGAAAKNTAVAANRAVRTRFPMLARAILSAPADKFATWRRSAATSCSVLDAPISTTMPAAVTSAYPVPDAMRSTVSIDITRSLARRRRVSPPILRTCVLRLQPSMRSFVSKDRTEGGR